MLKIHARNLDNVTVLCIEGRIVNGEMAVLREVVASQHTNSLVLDMSRVSTIDASGLGLMLELRNQTESRGARFKLMNVSKFVRRVFEITRLDSVFEVIPRSEPAISRGSTARVEWAACA